MCGRLVSGSDEHTWREWVGILLPDAPRLPLPFADADALDPSVGPGAPVVALLAAPANDVVLSTWGFRFRDDPRPYYNLRLETILAKQGGAVAARRCALPVLAFEVSGGAAGGKSKAKRPRHRVRAERAVFLAALWMPAPSDPSAKLVTVLTRASRGEIARFHDRSPAILATKGAFASWLGAGAAADVVDALLAEPDPTLTIEPVAPRARLQGIDGPKT